MAKENPRIGLDNVVIAELKSDTINGVVYDTPIALKGAVNASVNPNSDVAVDYADNGAFFVSNNRANTEINLEFTNIDPATKAKMLGQKRINGITVEKPQDQSPYFAIGFRVWIGGTDDSGNKIYEYFWYAKGKFSVPEGGGATKKDSMEFQHDTMVAQFVSTIYAPDEDKIGVICTHCRTDCDTPASIISGWFNQPVLTTSVNLGAVTVTASATGSKVTLTGSKTGGASFNFAESSVILGDTIIVADSDGSALAGTVKVGVAGTAPTIEITCSGTPAMVAVTNGLKDTNGVSVTPFVDSNL